MTSNPLPNHPSTNQPNSQPKMSTPSNSNPQTHPSLIGGHAQYIKGQAEAGIGAVTGSEAWKDSGESDRQEGIDAMKAASANRDAKQSGFGKAEEIAGKAVGCEGMEREGEESKNELRK
ncbi:hypothetical protein AC578_1398 [Pseudocercospora eumusae]|uniref:CsbD-like domain-containing protein n=1 Tax=Pseudocercospora eumusae TaxID=321146 RepID=A0A139HUR6_9PEZI|nr:hypothetical protein AC578_1398 [Pseudocercospora eumusae]